MKNILLTILCFVSICTKKSLAQADTFNLVDTIPVVVNGTTLNNPWAGGINFPLFSEIDLNGDGIHDLFMFDRTNQRISTFINDGTAGVNAWHYAPEYVSKFPPLNQWAFLYDYNCDGKADLFTLSPSPNGISVYRNDYNTSSGLQFTLVTIQLMEHYSTLLTNLYASTVQVPTFGDVDNDGDMDILGFNTFPDGRVVYNRNYSVEHGHGCDSLEFWYEDGAWGHFVGPFGSGGNAHVNCFNCRTTGTGNTTDADALINYNQSQASPRDDSYYSIFMIDINGDGLKDLLIGDSGANNSLLVTNGGTPDSAVMISQDTLFPGYNVSSLFNDFHNHAYIDVDNDGIKDLIVEANGFENYHDGVWFYKNNGTNSVPNFAFQSTSFLVDQMIDVGEGSCPALFDADNDGLQDLVIGNYGISQNGGGGIYISGLHLYKNTGTPSSPEFELVDSDYAGINALNITGPLFPTFGDLDGDGKVDMIFGEADGKIQFFHNTGGSPANFIHSGINYMGIDVGNSSTPQLIDLNRDGKLDLVIGEQSGNINYFENIGTPTVPFFANLPTNDTLGGIILHYNGSNGFTSPFIFNGQGGQYKLLVSCESGNVLLFDSIDGNLNGNFHLADTIVSGTEGVRYGYNLSISGGDLNNDSLTDFLLGVYGGGVSVYMHNNPALGFQNISGLQSGFMIAPNPATDQCTIQLRNFSSANKNQLSVMNYLGQTVFSKSFSTERITFNTHNLPAGVYMIHILSSEKSFSGKLVVKH